MKITVFDSHEAARPVWLESERQGHCLAFQTWGWCSAWLETIGKAQGVVPKLVHVEDADGNTVMFLPLVIERKTLGVRVLTFPDSRVTDYQAPILGPGISAIGDQQDFVELWNAIIDRVGPFDVIHIAKIPPTVGPAMNPLLHLSCRPYKEGAHQAGLSGTWDAFCRDRIKRGIRADSRRRMRRLEKRGEVRFVFAESQDQALDITREMIGQKCRRFHETNVYNLFIYPGYRDFYIRATENLFDSGGVAAAALMVDDVVVATDWGLVRDGRFYDLMSTYAGGEWRQYSPGRLLMMETIRWCFEKGLDVYDLSIGDEAYKNDWSDRSIELREFIRCRRPIGLIYMLRRRERWKHFLAGRDPGLA